MKHKQDYLFNKPIKRDVAYTPPPKTQDVIELLWSELDAKRFLGYEFCQQHPIGNFVIDFYCAELKLAIEIDSISQNFNYNKERERQQIIEQHGIKFLRFTDNEIKKNMESVLDLIKIKIDEWH